MLSRNIHLLSTQMLEGIREEENRRGGRFGMVGVKSDLGRVIDLSHCGALIEKKRFKRVPPLAQFHFTLWHRDVKATLMARLIRKQTVKGIGVVMGVEFLEVSAVQRDVLKQIVTNCRHWDALWEHDVAA